MVKMTKMKVLAGDPENEFDAEEMRDHSDNELAPTAAAKTPGKRGRLTKSTPAKKKKKPKVSDDEEILPKKDRGSKAKPTPPAPIPTSVRGRGRATKVLKVKPEEEPEDDKEDEEIKEEEDDDDDDVEEEEEELNQGSKYAEPAKNFTSGAFVVLKTDMIDKGYPFVWKIDGASLLQKYIPFKQDDKVLYINTLFYTGWDYHFKYRYYSAPVSFIQQTRNEHIIEFYKDQIKIDPKVEENFKKVLEEEEAELARDEAELAREEAELADKDNDEKEE
ncbi:uncharacterized protein LOC132940433 [Metopolophium dirhodum]|uniref:uncharacterized protein LOC132940433 n=1 Tax=Metopolophium dirhodum TaxID=44670 RepID=UPI00298F760E|nr:uncharacterized protein LOC132940433 [Metopolophium dirhodum]XP_060864037.1 uncharacterized protein LOC132940433 [Metopolophium dirhodum]